MDMSSNNSCLKQSIVWAGQVKSSQDKRVIDKTDKKLKIKNPDKDIKRYLDNKRMFVKLYLWYLMVLR